MKKAIIMLLSLLVVFSISACSKSNSNSADLEDSNRDYSYEVTEKQLTNAEIKLLVDKELTKEIADRYPLADVKSTQIEYANHQWDGDKLTVYGTFSLRDIYGDLTTGYVDGSGSYTKKYELSIKENGRFVNCTIKER